jgi:hypothetical protein
MNDTTQNFLDVFSNLEPWQPPVVFWRLYYDDAGYPLFYSMEDKPGNYINVTPEAFARSSMRVRVRDGKLIELNTNPVKKKVPADSGTPCHPQDVSIVVATSESHQYWRLKTNDAN